MNTNEKNETLKKSYDKFVILFLLLNCETNISLSELDEFIRESELMDFFTYRSLLTELCEAEYAETTIENSVTSYSITDEGINIVEDFDKLIPLSARTKILKYVDKNKIKVERKSDVSAHFFNDKETNSWKVKCNISDGDFVIMEFTLTVFSKNEAIKVASNWNNNCTDIYSTLLENLSKDVPVVENDDFYDSQLTKDEAFQILERGTNND